MRIIYKLLLGMLIFNVLFVSFTPFFPIGDTDEFSTGDITNPEGVAKYKNLDDGVLFTMLLTGIGTFFGAIGLIALGSFITGGSISLSLGSVIAVSTIASIISTIWSGFSTIFQPILTMGDTPGYNILGTFYTLFTIIFGVLVALTLAEMFGGQSGVDT